MIYVPDNHEEPLRDHTDLQFGGIAVLAEAIHEMADERRFLAPHRYAFDGIVTDARWLVLLASLRRQFLENLRPFA